MKLIIEISEFDNAEELQEFSKELSTLCSQYVVEYSEEVILK